MHGSSVTARGESQSGKPSVSVIAAVAEHEGIDEVELDPPLYEVINPEALDRLFRNSSGKVEFEYRGVTVAVDHEGTVTIAEAADA